MLLWGRWITAACIHVAVVKILVNVSDPTPPPLYKRRGDPYTKEGKCFACEAVYYYQCYPFNFRNWNHQLLQSQPNHLEPHISHKSCKQNWKISTDIRLLEKSSLIFRYLYRIFDRNTRKQNVQITDDIKTWRNYKLLVNHLKLDIKKVSKILDR